MATLTTSWQKVGYTSGFLGQDQLQLWAKYNSQSVANNTSSVSVELRFVTDQWNWIRCNTHSANFTGAFTDSAGESGYLHEFKVNSTYTLVSATKNISHDANGDLTINVGGYFTCSANISATVSQVSLTLPRIARGYSQTPSFSISDVQEDRITYSWSTSESTQLLQLGYKISGTSNYTWVNTTQTGTSGTNITTSPTGTGAVPLLATKTYDFCIKCTINNASALTATSNSIPKTMEAYPTVSTIATADIALPGAPITSSTVFSQTITIANKLNRTGITVYAQTQGTANTYTWSVGSVSGTSATINLKVAELYAALGSSGTLGKINYYCTYSGNTTGSYQGSFHTVKDNCRPYKATDSEHQKVDLTYVNSTDSHCTLLGSNQYIIQGKSAVTLYGPDYNLVANTSSEIAYYDIVIDGDTSKPLQLSSNAYYWSSISNDQDFTVAMKAVDKRGYSSETSTVIVHVLPYIEPSISLVPARTGDYEDETGEITYSAKRSVLMVGGVDKNYWVDSTNKKITYTISPTDSSLGSGGSINDTTATPIGSLAITSLSSDKAYVFKFNINDAITGNDTALEPQFREIQTDIAQAESLFDFNIESPAFGVGAIVNKSNVPTGVHAHGLYITDKTGVTSATKITSADIELGKVNGEANIKSYATISASKTITQPIASKTGETVTQTNVSCGEEIINNSIINGEVFIGGPQSNTQNGKIYLYNGTAYIPIIWYQSSNSS